MKWPFVTRRRYEEAVNRHHHARHEWARLSCAIAKHKQDAHAFYDEDEHDYWDRQLWDAISARIDVWR